MTTTAAVEPFCAAGIAYDVAPGPRRPTRRTTSRTSLRHLLLGRGLNPIRTGTSPWLWPVCRLAVVGGEAGFEL